MSTGSGFAYIALKLTCRTLAFSDRIDCRSTCSPYRQKPVHKFTSVLHPTRAPTSLAEWSVAPSATN